MQDTAYARAEYLDMMSNYPGVEISAWNKDMGNIVLSYLQMFDPDQAAKKFDQYWTQNLGIVKDNYTAGITYYNTHANYDWAFENEDIKKRNGISQNLANNGLTSTGLITVLQQW